MLESYLQYADSLPDYMFLWLAIAYALWLLTGIMVGKLSERIQLHRPRENHAFWCGLISFCIVISLEHEEMGSKYGFYLLTVPMGFAVLWFFRLRRKPNSPNTTRQINQMKQTKGSSNKSITLYDGTLVDGRPIKFSLESDASGNFWLTEETSYLKDDNILQFVRQLALKSNTPQSPRHFRMAIEAEIDSGRDAYHGLAKQFSKSGYGLSKWQLTEEGKSVAVDESIQHIVRIKQEIETEKLIERRWVQDGEKQFESIVLKHFDNGDLELEGYYLGSIAEQVFGDSDYEFGMNITKENAAKFREIIKVVNNPTDISQIKELCEKESIETFYWSWA